MNDDDTIDISGIDKAVLLAALVNGTRPLGMGTLAAELQSRLQGRREMTVERAQECINACTSWYFDYVDGRPIKTDIGGDVARTRFYDRDAGPGAFARVVAKLRA